MESLRKSGLNIANSVFFLLIAIGNLVSCITTSAPLWEFFAYTIPLIAGAFLTYLFKEKITLKIIAYIYISCSILSIVFGDHGNVSGAGYLIAGFYILKDKKIALYSLIISVIALLLKSIIESFRPSQIINYIAGYAHLAIILFLIFFHKPAKKFTEEDNEDIQILQYVVDDLSYKEIGDLKNLSQSAISKRLERFRGRMNAKSNEELAIILSRSGQIVLKSDR